MNSDEDADDGRLDARAPGGVILAEGPNFDSEDDARDDPNDEPRRRPRDRAERHERERRRPRKIQPKPLPQSLIHRINANMFQTSEIKVTRYSDRNWFTAALLLDYKYRVQAINHTSDGMPAQPKDAAAYQTIPALFVDVKPKYAAVCYSALMARGEAWFREQYEAEKAAGLGAGPMVSYSKRHAARLTLDPSRNYYGVIDQATAEVTTFLNLGGFTHEVDEHYMAWFSFLLAADYNLHNMRAEKFDWRSLRWLFKLCDDRAKEEESTDESESD